MNKTLPEQHRQGKPSQGGSGTLPRPPSQGLDMIVKASDDAPQYVKDWLTSYQALVNDLKRLREAVAWIDNAVGLLLGRAVPVLQAIQQKK